MKTCFNCKYFNNNYPFWKCQHPDNFPDIKFEEKNFYSKNYPYFPTEDSLPSEEEIAEAYAQACDNFSAVPVAQTTVIDQLPN